MRKVVAPLLVAALVLWSPVLPAQDLSSLEQDAREPESHLTRPPRGPEVQEPIARPKFDKLLEKLFKAGDTDGDGTITLAEFNALVDARKDRVIEQQFEAVDTSRDKTISKAEFFAWQRSLGSVVLSADDGDGASGRAGRSSEIVPATLPFPASGKSDEQQVARLVEPLSATLITAANTNYDAGMTLAELLAVENKTFDQADADHDGYLTPEELRAAGPRGGRRTGPSGAAAPPGAPRPPAPAAEPR